MDCGSCAPAIVVTALSVLQCDTVNDVAILRSAPDALCYTPRHKVYAIAFMVVLVVVTVVVPVAVLIVNYISVVGDDQHTGLSKVCPPQSQTLAWLHVWLHAWM